MNMVRVMVVFLFVFVCPDFHKDDFVLTQKKKNIILIIIIIIILLLVKVGEAIRCRIHGLNPKLI